MRWIDDVRVELAALDLSSRSLRRFGLTLGAALFGLGAWVAVRRSAPGPGAALLLCGLLLAAAGAARPLALRPLYRTWMALAFALGWVVSRAILTLLFLLAVTPLGLLGRLSGARFLELGRDPSAASYWTRRAPRRRDYEKMY